jgi:peroxiredoxin
MLAASYAALLVACSAWDAAAPTELSATPTVAATQPPPTPTATRTPTPTATAVPQVQLRPRVPIRDVPLTLFNGETLRLSDLRGQVVVMNFWASWCGPCVTEMPAFERVSNDYRDRGVTFLGIDSQDVELAARAFAERIGVTYALALDESGRLAVEFGLMEPDGVFPLPATLFLDRNGRPVRKFVGTMSEQMLRGLLEVMLDTG